MGDLEYGVLRFVTGLAKKLLIADPIGQIADAVFGVGAGELTTGAAWLGVACYALQIYFDFSGYSDMAIGLARMFGFRFPENFNYPYSAVSIQDFWRRWHITLSAWFRDYVYIPLGGNRFGDCATVRNLWIVFFLTGAWHGASWNFIVWGLWHGLFLSLERVPAIAALLERTPRVLRTGYVLLVVLDRLGVLPFADARLRARLSRAHVRVRPADRRHARRVRSRHVALARRDRDCVRAGAAAVAEAARCVAARRDAAACASRHPPTSPS